MKLKSDKLELTFFESSSSFELSSRTIPYTSLRSRLGVSCQIEGKTINLLDSSEIGQSSKIDTSDEQHPKMAVSESFQLSSSIPGLDVVLRFGLSPSEGMALIQLEIINATTKCITIDQITPLMIEAGDLQLGTPHVENPAFYSNGWQSWSSTSTFGLGDKQHTSILGRFQNPMVINPGTPQPKKRNHFTGELYGVLGDRNTRIGLLAGFLSQQNHFGSLETHFTPEPTLHMWANGDGAEVHPGSRVQTDWAVLSFVNLDDPDPLGSYYSAVATEHHFQSKAPVPVGWCSWYHFYDNITEPDIEANLKSVQTLEPELPLPLFQIDDGFETYPGDWTDFDPGFPNGLTSLVKMTQEAGLTPGIWLAPFIVHPKAKLVKDHPDWLLRDAHGKPVNAGFVWNAFTYALDLTNPDALQYTCDVIRTAVKDWGFTYLKLDFLYAAALNGVYQDRTQTRAQVLREGLAALREAAGPEITILACGCPLGSALGLFEAMRISADVSGHWKPHFPPVSLLLQNEPHMPSARNAIHNILTRAHLHRHWWINDPDCLLVRPDTDLTLAEVQTLATVIGLTGGSVLLSDNLPALPKTRLKIAQVLLPVIDQRAQVLDWFDTQMPSRLRVDMQGAAGEWHLLALFNWHNHPASLTFQPQAFNLQEEGVWWLREFWQGEIGQMSGDSPFVFYDVPPHGVRVVAVRRFQPQHPTYLGSDLHLSQGLEICRWEEDRNQLTLQFALGRRADGVLNFYLPWKPAGVWHKNTTHIMQDMGRGVYSVRLNNFEGDPLQIKG